MDRVNSIFIFLFFSFLFVSFLSFWHAIPRGKLDVLNFAAKGVAGGGGSGDDGHSLLLAKIARSIQRMQVVDRFRRYGFPYVVRYFFFFFFFFVVVVVTRAYVLLYPCLLSIFFFTPTLFSVCVPTRICTSDFPA